MRVRASGLILRKMVLITVAYTPNATAQLYNYKGGDSKYTMNGSGWKSG